MDYKKQESQMRELCTSLLTEAKVDVVIGFTSDQLDGRAIPYFAREARDVEALKWDDSCSPNLAKYVIDWSFKELGACLYRKFYWLAYYSVSDIEIRTVGFFRWHVGSFNY